MNGILICLFLISTFFFIGMFHSLVNYQRNGVYPPKRILKQRIIVFAGGGVITTLFSILLLIIF